MGRQAGGGPRLHCQFGAASTFLPHELDAVHYAYVGSYVSTLTRTMVAQTHPV